MKTSLVTPLRRCERRLEPPAHARPPRSDDGDGVDLDEEVRKPKRGDADERVRSEWVRVAEHLFGCDHHGFEGVPAVADDIDVELRDVIEGRAGGTERDEDVAERDFALVEVG